MRLPVWRHHHWLVDRALPTVRLLQLCRRNAPIVAVLLERDAAPAFAAVSRDGVRLLLSGPTSSGRRAMPEGTRPVPGGWNRLHLQVADLAGEVDRLRAAGCRFRNDIITGPGGSQILLEDPSGNVVELFQPAR